MGVSKSVDPEVIQFLKDQGRVILSFSGGKDSIAAWCVMKEIGVEVRAYCMRMIPGLSWFEDYLDYCEDVFGSKILRTQHPQMYHWVRTYQSQPPHRKNAIDFLQLPRFSFEDIERGVRRTLAFEYDEIDQAEATANVTLRKPKKGEKKKELRQLSKSVNWKGAWVAVGTRIVDSPMRRYRFKTLGWKRQKIRKVFPIYNFKKQDVVDVIKRHGVKLSPCYKMFGRSFDGVDFRYLDGIREYYPQDYQRILEWLPMQDVEFARVEFARRHGLAKIT